MAQQDFLEKTVIVTGASSGIGKACAEEFSHRGANVVLAARDEAKLQSIADALPNAALAVRTDVSKEADCERLAREAVQEFGKIDILVNNAGISMRAMFEDLDLAVLHRVMDVNFWGTVYCTKYALPHIRKEKGSIVGVSSIAGYRGLPGRTGYSASKFAMQGFMEALRTELLKTGVHVMVACPGFTASNIREKALTASGKKQGASPRDEEKMMSAEEVAKHIAVAVAKRKRTMILTNQGKLTVFFNKWLPKWMDKKVYEHMAKEGGPLE